MVNIRWVRGARIEQLLRLQQATSVKSTRLRRGARRRVLMWRVVGLHSFRNGYATRAAVERYSLSYDLIPLSYCMPHACGLTTGVQPTNH